MQQLKDHFIGGGGVFVATCRVKNNPNVHAQCTMGLFPCASLTFQMKVR